MHRKYIALLLIVQIAGMHWAVLQGVAWTRMLVDYSRQGSLLQGARQTFDGAHPCSMCKLIKAAKAQTERAQDKLSAPPLETIWMALLVQAVRANPANPAYRAPRSPPESCHSRNRDRPPLPPPR